MPSGLHKRFPSNYLQLMVQSGAKGSSVSMTLILLNKVERVPLTGELHANLLFVGPNRVGGTSAPTDGEWTVIAVISSL